MRVSPDKHFGCVALLSNRFHEIRSLFCRVLLVVISLLLGVGGAGTGVAVSAAMTDPTGDHRAAEDHRAEIRALARLYRAYDLSIRSIEVDTVQWIFPTQFPPSVMAELSGKPPEPSPAHGWNGWGRFWMGQHGFDGENAYIWGQGTGTMGGLRMQFVDSGGYRRGVPRTSQQRGVLRGVSDIANVKLWQSPLKMIGRWYESHDMRSIAEEVDRLARSGLVEVGDSAGGMPCLTFVPAKTPWLRASVWLDPEHGFGTRRIYFWDNRRERPSSDTRVVEFTLADGLWIPTAYAVCTYFTEQIHATDRDRYERSFEEVVKAVGALDMPFEFGRTGPAVREAVLEMLIGGEETPRAPHEPGKALMLWQPGRDSRGHLFSPQIGRARVLTVNKGLSDLAAVTRWDRNVPVSDFFARVPTTFSFEPGSWTLEDAPITAASAATVETNPLPPVAQPSDPPALRGVHEVHPPNLPGVVVGQLDLLSIARADPENFGVRRAGSRVSRTVTFGNPTVYPVRVKITGTTCGCTSAGFSREEVGPGESTDLTLTADVPASPTPQRQFVSFSVERVGAGGAGEVAGLPMQQSAMVGIAYRAEWSVRPEPEIVRRIVRAGEEVRNVISFYSGPPAFAFPLERLKSTLPELVLSGPKRFVTDPPGEDADYVRALVLSGVFEAPGLYEGALRESAEDVQGEYSPLEISVVVKVEPGWSSTPHAWTSRRPPSPDERVVLRLRRDNQRVAQVAGVRLDPTDAPARAVLRHEADGTATVEVVFSAEASGRRAEGFDVVLVDGRGRVQLEIPVAWWAGPRAPERP
jgi:hypothetical protein